MYNAFDSCDYQTLKGVHFEKWYLRLFIAFDSFYYQTLKGVHIEKLDFRMHNAFDRCITKHVGPPIVQGGCGLFVSTTFGFGCNGGSSLSLKE